MSTPAQQHNALLAVGELMKIMIDEERYPDLPERLGCLLKHSFVTIQIDL